LPYPDSTCAATATDPRIKVIIPLDGSSNLSRYGELARIGVPSLIMGQTVEGLAAIGQGIETWMARPHAAINRPDSIRVDLDGANHHSFSNLCDAVRVAGLHGVFSQWWVDYFWNGAECDNPLSPTVAHQVITMYMVAFLDTYFRPPGSYQSILTPDYAATHTPTVQFFDSENCLVTLPDDSYFAYRPHQLTAECLAAPKDPSDYF